MSTQYSDDDWLTPPAILRALGHFDLDPCAPEHRPWDMAGHHFSPIDNGLRQQWFGRVWMNPPYSDMETWIEKLLRHVQNQSARSALGQGSALALYNARTETQWFFKGVWSAAHAVLFPNGRLKFYRPDGTFGDNGGKCANVIVAYSAADAAALRNASLHCEDDRVRHGKFIPLMLGLSASITTTWRSLVRFLLKECNGTATLEQLYDLVEGHPKTANNPNWKAKVRQQAQSIATRTERSTYSLQLALV